MPCLKWPGGPLTTHDPPLATSPFGTPYSGNANHIKLYDARNFDTGPFETFPLGHAEVADFLAAHMNTTLASEQTQVDRVVWGRVGSDPRHLSDPRQPTKSPTTHRPTRLRPTPFCGPHRRRSRALHGLE